MTLNTVGLDGVINITESPTGFSRFAMVNGLVYERGFVSSLFVETMQSDEPEVEDESPAAKWTKDLTPDQPVTNTNLVCELEQPLILVVANSIDQVE